ncbi:HNH endonuclease [Nocardia puris]|uniref:HNH endonuclease n=1 Tax=Nocardia puris TaxID=208602 RepID=UPI00189570E7|nr:HNH endonuclease [Nocardia puris]
MAWSRDPDRYRGVDRTTARRIRTRDNVTCQKCGNPGHQVDHKLSVAAGGTDADDNLWTLCDDCHGAKTAGESAAGRARWRQRHSRLREPEPHPGALRQANN